MRVYKIIRRVWQQQQSYREKMYFDNLGDLCTTKNYFSANELRTEINRIKAGLSNIGMSDKGNIGIVLRRNVNMITVIIALIESNITFVPIDASFPKERQRYMLDKADIKYVIYDEVTAKFEGYNYICVNELKQNGKTIVSNRERSAYILFTSGTTGNPKAVEITMEGFSNFIYAIPDVIEFGNNRRIACFTSYTFDIFFLETVLPMYYGMTVCLADEEEVSSPKLMAEFIVNNHVEIIQMTPSRMKLLNMYDKSLASLESVQIIMLGGEVFTKDLLKLLKENTKARLYNMYGPTETTIWSCVSEVTNKDEADIGMPIANTTIYITDDAGNELDEGKVGNICIGGSGLAKGYYGNEELTNERFIFLPQNSCDKVYLTGDLGKKVGELYYYHGRKDRQIKYHGYRIELEDIEEKFLMITDIKAAVVCYDDAAEKLIAFYISDGEMENSLIMDGLRKYLPEYMVPQQYYKVDKFLYTSSGKLDRNAMLAFAMDNVKATDDNNESSANEVTQGVLEIIRKELNGSNCEINEMTGWDNMGIDSITFIRIIVEIEDMYDVEFEGSKMRMDAFETIGSMVKYLLEII